MFVSENCNKLTTSHLFEAGEELVCAFKSIAWALGDLFECAIVAVPRHDACPSTLKGISACIEQRSLPISEQGGAGTFYGTEGNFYFRAAHDLCHHLYGLDTTTVDEKSLSIKMWRQLVLPLLKRRGADIELAKYLYFADTYGQTLYWQERRAFVPDQIVFVQSTIGVLLGISKYPRLLSEAALMELHHVIGGN